MRCMLLFTLIVSSLGCASIEYDPYGVETELKDPSELSSENDELEDLEEVGDLNGSNESAILDVPD